MREILKRLTLYRISNGAYFAVVAILYLLLSSLFLLSWPPPWPDESIFADVARTFFETGHLGTTTVRGMEGHFYWYPPVYFLVSALTIQVAGFDIIPLRIFSVIIGVGVLAAFFSLALKVSKSSFAARLGLILLALNPQFVTYVKLIRMDGLCVLFTLVAVLVYLNALQRQSTITFLFAGSFLALAVLTHPLGLIGVVGITLHFLVYQRHVDSPGATVLLLVIPMCVGLFLWGFYILQDPGAFFLQMKYMFAFKDRPLLARLEIFMRRYQSTPVVLMMLVACLIYFVPKLFRRQSDGVALIILCMSISLAVVGLNFDVPYHVYMLPFATMAMAMLLNEGWQSSSLLFSRASMLMTTALAVNFFLYVVYITYVFHFKLESDTNYAQYVMKVEQHISPGSKVYLYGYPDVFWGLQRSNKHLSFVQGVYLDDQNKLEVVEGVDFVVLTRGFDPARDVADLQKHRDGLQQLCSRNNHKLVLVAGVGTKRKYAYSADIYKFIPVDSVITNNQSR